MATSVISGAQVLVYDVLAVSVMSSSEWNPVRKGAPVSARLPIMSVVGVKVML